MQINYLNWSCDEANSVHDLHNKITLKKFPTVKGGWSISLCSVFHSLSLFRMGQGGNMVHLTHPSRRQKEQEPLELDPLFIRFLRTFREILKFILFSYTVLFGALLLARWTTYFMVGK